MIVIINRTLSENRSGGAGLRLEESWNSAERKKAVGEEQYVMVVANLKAIHFYHIHKIFIDTHVSLKIYKFIIYIIYLFIDTTCTYRHTTAKHNVR